MPVVVEPRGRELIIPNDSDLMSSIRPPNNELILRDAIHKMPSVWVLALIQYMTENQINEYRRSLVQFLKDLLKSKYHKWAPDLGFMYRQKILMRASDTGPGFKQGQTLYFKTKLHLQQNIFRGDPTQQCQKIYEHCEKMFEEEKNEDKKKEMHLKMMKYAYICTSCLCAALDAEITRWNTSFDWDDSQHVFPKTRLQCLLNELYGFINKTPNPQIVEVALFSRIAIAYAMAGQLAKADDYIEKAFASSIDIPRCTELEFMFRIYTMILLFKYQDDPTELLSERFLHIVQCGLQIIEDETDESKRYFWMRMILLRKVFLLLALGNKMEVINGWVYKEEHVKKAEELLVEIEKMGEMEKRREMFFYMAKARISELQNSLEFAVYNIRKAIDCDELGYYGETAYAREYEEMLENKIEEQQRLTLRHTIDGPNSQEYITPVYSTCHSEITIPKRID